MHFWTMVTVFPSLPTTAKGTQVVLGNLGPAVSPLPVDAWQLDLHGAAWAPADVPSRMMAATRLAANVESFERLVT